MSITSCRLVEVSLTPIGADDQAKAAVVSESLQPTRNEREF